MGTIIPRCWVVEHVKRTHLFPCVGCGAGTLGYRSPPASCYCSELCQARKEKRFCIVCGGPALRRASHDRTFCSVRCKVADQTKKGRHPWQLVSRECRSAKAKKQWQTNERFRIKMLEVNSLNGVKSANTWKRIEFVDGGGRRWTMKSSWEVEFARELDRRGFEWAYEPQVLRLSDGRRYVPDFFVPELDSFVEVKGWPFNTEKYELAVHDGHKILLTGKTYQERKKSLAFQPPLQPAGW